MNAEQMFKELGYEKQIFNYVDVIQYCKSDDEMGIDDFIDFDTALKTYTAYSWCNNSISNMHKKRLEMEELKAISRQCKELGWLD